MRLVADLPCSQRGEDLGALKEFAETDLPGRMHRALVEEAFSDTIEAHVFQDAAAIEAREKPAQKPKKEKRKRGCPPKGEECPKEPSRLERQLAGIATGEMAADLPSACDVGARNN